MVQFDELCRNVLTLSLTVDTFLVLGKFFIKKLQIESPVELIACFWLLNHFILLIDESHVPEKVKVAENVCDDELAF
jgi:hypothetical protein